MGKFEELAEKYIIFIFTGYNYNINNYSLIEIFDIKNKDNDIILIKKDMEITLLNKERSIEIEDKDIIFVHPDNEPAYSLKEKIEKLEKIALVCIHQGSENEIKNKQRSCFKNKGIIREYIHVRRRNSSSLWDPVWEYFCQICISLKFEKKNEFMQNFINLCHACMSLLKRLAVIKHKLNHLFLPIDIDLQGLIESDFNEEYWKEIKVAWNENEIKKIISKAKNLIYGNKEEGDYIVKIIEEAIGFASKEEEKNKIKVGKAKINELFPIRKAKVPNELGAYMKKYYKAIKILSVLSCGEKEELINLLRKEGNCFHDWLVSLNKVIDEIENEIEVEKKNKQ